MEELPNICDIICDYIEKNKEKYLLFPYLNKKVDLNLVLWQQISMLANGFIGNVEKILVENHFAQVDKIKRPFSVFGYIGNGKYYELWNAQAQYYKEEVTNEKGDEAVSTSMAHICQ